MKRQILIAAVSLLVFAACSKEELDLTPSSEGSKADLKSYQSGINNGFFWSLWTNDGTGYVNYTNGPGGNYAVSWNYSGNFTCGKGYTTGSPYYKIGYNLGAYTNNGGGTFGWYGWSRNPYYEYYVNETWGTESPHTGTYLGTLSTDGAGYNVYTRWVSNTNIDGGWGFRQIYSSRNWKITPGRNYVITFLNHYNKWKSLGYTLGSMDIPAIMVTEGWGTNVSGYANCTIWAQ